MQTSGQFGVPHQAGGEVPQFLSRAQTHHMFNLSTSDMGTLSPSNSSSHAPPPHHLHSHLNPPQPQAQAQSSAGAPAHHRHHHHQQELPHSTHHPLDLLPHAHHHNHHHFHNHQLFSQSQIGLAAQIKHQDEQALVPQPQQQQQEQQQQHHHQQQHAHPSVHLQHHHQQSSLPIPSPQASPTALHTNTSAAAPQLLSAHPSSSVNNPPNVHPAHVPIPSLDSNPNPNLNPNPNPNPNSNSNAIPIANPSKLDTAPPPIMTQSHPTTQGNAIANMNVAAPREESYDGDEQEVLGEEAEVKGGGAAGAGGGGGGSRWPRQEALALLKVRSDMDSIFRDSSLKGPLWEAVSRKLADLGYRRSAKKCKEKFENVHKYYKRTKEGRAGRQDGKSYRFFSQLEALYGKTGEENATMSNAIAKDMTSPRGIMLLQHHQPSPSSSLHYLHHSSSPNMPMEIEVAVPHIQPPTIPREAFPPCIAPHLRDNASRLKLDSGHSSSGLNFSSDSSDNDDYDDDDDGNIDSTPTKEHITPPSHGRKRKRTPLLLSKKYLAFFENVMKRLLQKQEQMQQKFLEALERRDQDRMIREEAWKRQEMTRLSREHDLRTQERALAASRDAALIAFLQKITGQSSIQLPASAQTAIQAQPLSISPFDMKEDYQHDNEYYDPNSKRWPKPEVIALIKLRTALDQKFHEPGSKSQLWEEISATMASQGFSRSAKRCREKWENINKYFKKAKESNKKRPENAKTCPYYHQLDALYKEGVLGSPYSSKQLLLLDKGEEEQSGNLNVNIPHTKEEGEVQQGTQGGVSLTAEMLEAKPTRNIEGAEMNLTSGNINPSKETHALPLFMSSDNAEVGGKHVNQTQPIDALTVSPPNASSSLSHMLEREQTLDRSLVDTTKSSLADHPQQKDLQFGSIMQ